VHEKGVYIWIDLPSDADNQDFAMGINNAGRIVESYKSATSNHGFLAAPTRGQEAP